MFRPTGLYGGQKLGRKPREDDKLSVDVDEMLPLG